MRYPIVMGMTLLVVFFRKYASDVWIDWHTGAMRRGHRGFGDVAALSSGWFQANNLIQCSCEVLGELFSREAGITDDEVQVCVTINAEIDLAALDVLDCLSNVRCNSPGTWVWIEVTWDNMRDESTNVTDRVRWCKG